MRVKLYTPDSVIYLTEVGDGKFEVKYNDEIIDAYELSFFSRASDWALDHRFSERPEFSKDGAPDFLRFENSINPLMSFESGKDENGIRFYLARYYDILCLEMGSGAEASILVLKTS